MIVSNISTVSYAEPSTNDSSPTYRVDDQTTINLRPVAHAINRLNFSGAGFSFHVRLEWNFVAPEINMAENIRKETNNSTA